MNMVIGIIVFLVKLIGVMVASAIGSICGYFLAEEAEKAKICKSQIKKDDEEFEKVMRKESGMCHKRTVVIGFQSSKVD